MFKQFNYLTMFETLEYIFEGAMVPFIVLGETAERIRGVKDLTGLEIVEIGIREKDLSDYSRRTFRDRWGENWENEVHKIDEIPVKVKVIKKKYSFLQHPDSVAYYAGIFLTPNPFDKYWKVRNLVK